MKYQVYLEAEDGDYAMTGPISEKQAVEYIRQKEQYYGEGQQLVIREAPAGWTGFM